MRSRGAGAAGVQAWSSEQSGDLPGSQMGCISIHAASRSPGAQCRLQGGASQAPGSRHTIPRAEQRKPQLRTAHSTRRPDSQTQPTSRRPNRARGRLRRPLLGPPGAHPTPAGTMPSSEAHHCWSNGAAPRCRSCGSPGLEATGQRARPSCRTGPSQWQGGGGGEEPRTLPSWLAQGALKRGTVVSTITRREGEAMGGRTRAPGFSPRPGQDRLCVTHLPTNVPAEPAQSQACAQASACLPPPCRACGVSFGFFIHDFDF